MSTGSGIHAMEAAEIYCTSGVLLTILTDHQQLKNCFVFTFILYVHVPPPQLEFRAVQVGDLSVCLSGTDQAAGDTVLFLG